VVATRGSAIEVYGNAACYQITLGRLVGVISDACNIYMCETRLITRKMVGR